MSRARLLAAVAILGFIALSAGCRSITVRTDGYSLPEPTPTGRALAGVARVDITPPPGFPTGGHGPAGYLARGYWTRLWARAFFFQDAQGRNLVLVSADLFAIPGGLQAAVAKGAAEALADKTALPPASIVVAATHTHQSPGNFTTAKTYTDYAAFYDGFSQDMFDFLAKRLTEAVVLAANDAFENPGSVKLVLQEASADPERVVLFNRAPRAFLLNHDAAGLMDELDGPLAYSRR